MRLKFISSLVFPFSQLLPAQYWGCFETNFSGTFPQEILTVASGCPSAVTHFIPYQQHTRTGGKLGELEEIICGPTLRSKAAIE